MGKAVALEVRTERDRAYHEGAMVEVLRVLYRLAGSRRWTRVVVFPDARQTVGELEQHAHTIADTHYRELHGG